MRRIDEIIVHCTATPQGMAVSVDDIDRWHRQRGFACIGYHYVVYLDGTVHAGRPIERTGAHCKGHNAHSIGICYVGGLDLQRRPKDTRTPAQKQALRALVATLKTQYPNAKVYGHRQLAAHKACPCFDVEKEFGNL